MSNYYRITAYYPAEDCTFIVDSHGKFEKLWQFSAYLVSKGVKVLEVSGDDKFLDGNIARINPHAGYLYVQACSKARPTISTVTINGRTYRTIEVAGKKYIPNKNDIF